MTWEEVRAQYPNQFIIFEAHQWEDGGEHRHILEMTVVASNCAPTSLLSQCAAISHLHPERTLYPSNTAWESPRIKTPLRMTLPLQYYDNRPATLPMTLTLLV